MKCILTLNNCFERTPYFVEMESESIALHITCDILGVVRAYCPKMSPHNLVKAAGSPAIFPELRRDCTHSSGSRLGSI